MMAKDNYTVSTNASSVKEKSNNDTKYWLCVHWTYLTSFGTFCLQICSHVRSTRILKNIKYQQNLYPGSIGFEKSKFVGRTATFLLQSRISHTYTTKIHSSCTRHVTLRKVWCPFPSPWRSDLTTTDESLVIHWLVTGFDLKQTKPVIFGQAKLLRGTRNALTSQRSTSSVFQKEQTSPCF